MISISDSVMSLAPIKPGKYVATVWGAVAASCNQSQISDNVRYFPKTIRRVSSHRSVYLQVQEPM